MIPIYDENPTLRTPIISYLLIVLIAAAWIFLQGAGFNATILARSVCELGLVAGEITGLAPVGTSIPIGPGLACVVDRQPINLITPITSMFMHGSWGHIISNLIFFKVFGNNVEDVLGRFRFVFFYLICGLMAAAAQVVWDPSSPIPMVGASGAISGVMGAYLVLFPQVRVHMLFIFIIIIRVIPLPAWLVLIWWFALQTLQILPELAGTGGSQGGVAFMAHIGGFVAGIVLAPLLRKPDLWQRHSRRLKTM